MVVCNSREKVDLMFLVQLSFVIWVWRLCLIPFQVHLLMALCIRCTCVKQMTGLAPVTSQNVHYWTTWRGGCSSEKSLKFVNPLNLLCQRGQRGSLQLDFDVSVCCNPFCCFHGIQFCLKPLWPSLSCYSTLNQKVVEMALWESPWNKAEHLRTDWRDLVELKDHQNM